MMNSVAMPIRTCVETWVTCIVGERRVQVAREAVAHSSERTIVLLDPERYNALSYATIRGLVNDARKQRTTELPGEGIAQQQWLLVIATNESTVVDMIAPRELVIVERDGCACRVDTYHEQWEAAWGSWDERLGDMWEARALFTAPWVRVFTP